jgi:hypothetical protein
MRYAQPIPFGMAVYQIKVLQVLYNAISDTQAVLLKEMRAANAENKEIASSRYVRPVPKPFKVSNLDLQ